MTETGWVYQRAVEDLIMSVLFVCYFVTFSPGSEWTDVSGSC